MTEDEKKLEDSSIEEDMTGNTPEEDGEQAKEAAEKNPAGENSGEDGLAEGAEASLSWEDGSEEEADVSVSWEDGSVGEVQEASVSWEDGSAEEADVSVPWEDGSVGEVQEASLSWENGLSGEANVPPYEEQAVGKEAERKKERKKSSSKKSAKEGAAQPDRKKRVKRIKKIIVVLLLVLILVPIVLSVICMARINYLEKELDRIQISLQELVTVHTQLQQEPQKEIQEVVETVSDNLAPDAAPQEAEVTVKKKNVCLTFDDGPSGQTDAILDVLDLYGIKGTFFVTGKGGYRDQYRRIADEGHTIGMHSYGHKYDVIYKDLYSFTEDYNRIQQLLTEITGEPCKYYRFPGGSSNTVSTVDMKYCIAFLEQEGVQYIDWNISSEDAAGATTVEEILENVMGQIGNSQAETLVILMHDSGYKTATVEALPIVIEKIMAMDDLQLVPMSGEVNLVQHVSLAEEEKEEVTKAMEEELERERREHGADAQE